MPESTVPAANSQCGAELSMSEAEALRATMFERLGGADAIDRLVEAFYHRMDVLPEREGIRAMHGRDLGPTKQALKRYLSEWTGGPKLYTPEKGHPRLRQRHLHVSRSISRERTPGCFACAARSRRRSRTPPLGRRSTKPLPSSRTGCATRREIRMTRAGICSPSTRERHFGRARTVCRRNSPRHRPARCKASALRHFVISISSALRWAI